MTVGQIAAEPAAGPFPAPGADIPGAPPALTRPLTDDDGAPARPAADAGRPPVAAPAVPVAAAPPPVSAADDPTERLAVTVAAAMAGTALGLLAGHRRGRGRR